MKILFIILIILIIIKIFKLFPNTTKFLVEYWIIPIANLLNEIKDKVERWLNNASRKNK